MSDREPRTCSRCGDEGHDRRTCTASFKPSYNRDCPGEQCLYELGGIYCPDCHRGD